MKDTFSKAKKITYVNFNLLHGLSQRQQAHKELMKALITTQLTI